MGVVVWQQRQIAPLPSEDGENSRRTISVGTVAPGNGQSAANGAAPAPDSGNAKHNSKVAWESTGSGGMVVGLTATAISSSTDKEGNEHSAQLDYKKSHSTSTSQTAKKTGWRQLPLIANFCFLINKSPYRVILWNYMLILIIWVLWLLAMILFRVLSIAELAPVCWGAPWLAPIESRCSCDSFSLKSLASAVRRSVLVVGDKSILIPGAITLIIWQSKGARTTVSNSTIGIILSVPTVVYALCLWCTGGNQLISQLAELLIAAIFGLMSYGSTAFIRGGQFLVLAVLTLVMVTMTQFLITSILGWAKESGSDFLVGALRTTFPIYLMLMRRSTIRVLSFFKMGRAFHNSTSGQDIVEPFQISFDMPIILCTVMRAGLYISTVNHLSTGDFRMRILYQAATALVTLATDTYFRSRTKYQFSVNRPLDLVTGYTTKAEEKPKSIDSRSAKASTTTATMIAPLPSQYLLPPGYQVEGAEDSGNKVTKVETTDIDFISDVGASFRGVGGAIAHTANSDVEPGTSLIQSSGNVSSAEMNKNLPSAKTDKPHNPDSPSRKQSLLNAKGIDVVQVNVSRDYFYAIYFATEILVAPIGWITIFIVYISNVQGDGGGATNSNICIGNEVDEVFTNPAMPSACLSGLAVQLLADWIVARRTWKAGHNDRAFSYVFQRPLGYTLATIIPCVSVAYVMGTYAVSLFRLTGF